MVDMGSDVPDLRNLLLVRRLTQVVLNVLWEFDLCFFDSAMYLGGENGYDTD